MCYDEIDLIMSSCDWCHLASGSRSDARAYLIALGVLRKWTAIDLLEGRRYKPERGREERGEEASGIGRVKRKEEGGYARRDYHDNGQADDMIG